MIELIQFFIKYLDLASLKAMTRVSVDCLRVIESLGHGLYSPRLIKKFGLSGLNLNVVKNHDDLYSRFSNVRKIKLLDRSLLPCFSELVNAYFSWKDIDNSNWGFIPTMQTLVVRSSKIKINMQLLPNLKKLVCLGSTDPNITHGKNSQLIEYGSNAMRVPTWIHKCSTLKILNIPCSTIYVYKYLYVEFLRCFALKDWEPYFPNGSSRTLQPPKFYFVRSR